MPDSALRTIRIARNLTREQLGERIGVTGQTVWRDETQPAKLNNRDKVRRYAEALRVTEAQIIGEAPFPGDGISLGATSGAATPAGEPVDMLRLAAIVSSAERYMLDAGIEAPQDVKAAMYARLYEALKGEPVPDERQIAPLIRLELSRR